MFGTSRSRKLLIGAVLAAMVVSVAMPVLADSGTFKGVVVGKADAAIRVQNETGDVQNFVPAWTNPSGRHGAGSLDQAAIDAIGSTPKGSTVSIAWQRQGRNQCIVKLIVLSLPDDSSDTEGTFVGPLVDHGEAYVVLKSGEGRTVKFTAPWKGSHRDGKYDSKVVNAIVALNVNSRVYVKWDTEQGADGKDAKTILEIRPAKDGEKTTYLSKKATSSPSDSEGGTIVGTVEDKSDVSLSLKSGGKTDRYAPMLQPAEENKPPRLDPDMLKVFANVKYGATLQITFVVDGHTKRVTALKTVPKGTTQPVDDSGTPLADKPKDTTVKTVETYKEGDEGTASGTVEDRTETSVTVLTNDDPPRHMKFSPKWVGGSPADGGGLDQAMQKAMAALKPGQKVTVKWIYQERSARTASPRMSPPPTPPRPRPATAGPIPAPWSRRPTPLSPSRSAATTRRPSRSSRAGWAAIRTTAAGSTRTCSPPSAPPRSAPR